MNTLKPLLVMVYVALLVWPSLLDEVGILKPMKAPETTS